MDHVGIVVEDMAAAIEFFAELGLVLDSQETVDGRTVDRIVGLDGVHAELAWMEAPDGRGRIELIRFASPASPGGDPDAPSNTPGIRHVAFEVDDIDAAVSRLCARGASLVGGVERYRDSYRLCYLRGPEGIIVELAEPLGR